MRHRFGTTIEILLHARRHKLPALVQPALRAGRSGCGAPMGMGDSPWAPGPGPGQRPGTGVIHDDFAVTTGDRRSQ
jgi:hypothetical protein